MGQITNNLEAEKGLRGAEASGSADFRSQPIFFTLYNLQHPVAIVDSYDCFAFQNPSFETLEPRIKAITADILKAPIRDGSTVLEAIRAGDIKDPYINEFTGPDISFKLSVSAIYNPWGEIDALVDINDTTDQTLRKNAVLVVTESLSSAMHILAHDIKNPLTVTLGNAQLLRRRIKQETLTDDDRDKFVDEIISSAKRADTLLSDGIKEITATVKELNPITVSVEDFLLSVKNDPENIALMDIRKINLEIILPNQPRQILIYKRQFLRFIRTLLLNSYQEEAGQIRIWSEFGDKETIIYLEDNGRGMSEEVRKKCMEAGFTTKTGTDHEGTGMGLSNVLQGVKNCGGKFYLDWSEFGKGTRFAFVLPIPQETA